MQLFYSNNITAHSVVLTEEESIHCNRVLRKKLGDEIFVINGKGKLWKCEIAKIHDKGTEAKIIALEKEEENAEKQLHIAICPTKNADRIEWFVEKAIEIGVQKISFVLSQRTERKTINLERIQKIALSAAKQSMDLYLPNFEVYQSVQSFVDSNTNSSTFIAHLLEMNNVFLGESIKNQINVTVLIGPEGDFTEKEIEYSLDKGAKSVTLGIKRLRTETAGVMVAAVFATVNLIN